MTNLEMCTYAQQEKNKLIKHILSGEAVNDSHLLQYLAYRGLCEDVIMDEQREHLWTPLNEMANEQSVTDADLEKWVSSFQNVKGTTGSHWNMDSAKQVNLQYDICKSDFIAWVTLNMMYSDYYSPDFTIKNYAELAKQFLTDPDSGLTPRERVIHYYLYMRKGA